MCVCVCVLVCVCVCVCGVQSLLVVGGFLFCFVLGFFSGHVQFI